MVRCRGLPTNMVLGILLFVYTSSVRSLETGYEYTGVEPVERDELYKDLKCGYLYGWYTQMRLIRVLLENNTEWKAIVSAVGNMNTVVRSQIVTLFNIAGMRIGAMWLLHLFTSLQTAVYKDSGNPAEELPKIIETLGYVIEKLEGDLAGCRQGNSFDSYKSTVESDHQQFEYVLYTKTIVPDYITRANIQLEANNRIRSNRARLDSSIKTQTLLFSNFGMKDNLIFDFQYVYNLQIIWNNASPRLNEAWKNARDLDWKRTMLRHIKSYYNTCYDFLYIIIYRLTSKHMEYLRFYVGPSYKLYMQEWYNIVVRFGTILHLSEDLKLRNLLHVLVNLINGIETIDGVVIYIAKKLYKLCQPFRCVASRPFVIDNQEFQIKHTSLSAKELKFLKITYSPLPVEFNSLTNAKTFLSHLQSTFLYVDFNVIRALVTYIDELNPVNSAEIPDDWSEEIEHILVDIADYQ